MHKTHLILTLLLMTMAACGTTFTATKDQTVNTILHPPAPGQVQVKIDKNVACTVNAVGPIALQITCDAGQVPWYDGLVPTCIDNPCIGGTALTHNPDATISCQ